MTKINRRLFVLGAAAAVALPATAQETDIINVTSFVQEIVRGYRSPRTHDEDLRKKFIAMMLTTVPHEAPVPGEVKARLVIYATTSDLAFILPALIEEQTPEAAQKHDPNDKVVVGILSDFRKEIALFAEYLTIASDLCISRVTENGKSRFYTVAEIVARANEELAAAVQNRPEALPHSPPCRPPTCLPG
jgi:hypothetical protein